MDRTYAAGRQGTAWAGGRVPNGRALLLLLPALFAAMTLSALAAGSGVLAGDVTVSRFVQRAPDPVIGDVARAVNVLGDTPVMLALGGGLVLALLTLGRTGPAFFLTAALLACVAGPLLKAMIESPRPTADLVRIAEQAPGLGFPSGHVTKVVLIYGAILLLSRELLPRQGPRLLVQGWAVGMIVATGFSRIYVGAHWPSDVVGGYLWSGVLLGVLGIGYRHAWIAQVRAVIDVLQRGRRELRRDGLSE